MWGNDLAGQVLKTINLSSLGINQITNLRATSTELILLEEWGKDTGSTGYPSMER
jgi:hypothetical protein